MLTDICNPQLQIPSVQPTIYLTCQPLFETEPTEILSNFQELPLISFTIHTNKTAPINAVTRWPISPPAWMPSQPNTEPPSHPPMRLLTPAISLIPNRTSEIKTARANLLRPHIN